eukprot:358126-Chlamydomonas_euryale.AAC.4
MVDCSRAPLVAASSAVQNVLCSVGGVRSAHLENVEGLAATVTHSLRERVATGLKSTPTLCCRVVPTNQTAPPGDEPGHSVLVFSSSCTPVEVISEPQDVLCAAIAQGVHRRAPLGHGRYSCRLGVAAAPSAGRYPGALAPTTSLPPPQLPPLLPLPLPPLRAASPPRLLTTPPMRLRSVVVMNGGQLPNNGLRVGPAMHIEGATARAALSSSELSPRGAQHGQPLEGGGNHCHQCPRICMGVERVCMVAESGVVNARRGLIRLCVEAANRLHGPTAMLLPMLPAPLLPLSAPPLPPLSLTPLVVLLPRPPPPHPGGDAPSAVARGGSGVDAAGPVAGPGPLGLNQLSTGCSAGHAVFTPGAKTAQSKYGVTQRRRPGWHWQVP